MTNLQYGLHGQDSEILRFIIESGKIDINDVLNSMEAMKRKELLEKHPYKIWQGKSPHKIRKTYGSILLDNHIDNNWSWSKWGVQISGAQRNIIIEIERILIRKAGVSVKFQNFKQIKKIIGHMSDYLFDYFNL